MAEEQQKKRGRPRKADSEKVEPIVQPKRRGRPPKNPITIVSETSSKSSTAKKPNVVSSASASKSNATKKTTSPAKRTTSRRKVAQGELVFALDIGTRTIIGILGKRVGEKFEILDIEVCEHKKRAMIDGQIEDIEQVGLIVAEVKNALEKRNFVQLERVSVAAAGRALRTIQSNQEFDVSDRDFVSSDFIKSMEIEAVQKAQKMINEAKTDKEMEFYCVGHTVIKYTLDGYKMTTVEGHKGQVAGVEVIAAFLPNLVLESLYAVMDNNSLMVESLTLEPIAAMNVVIPPEIRLINIALVDIGAGTSDIAISRDGSIVAYGMAVMAGDEITEEIIRTFLVDFGTAEQMKKDSVKDNFKYVDIFGITHEIDKDTFIERISNASELLAKTISDEIMRANAKAPQAVFLVGGGSKLKGLTDKIAQKLNIESSRVAVGTQGFIKNIVFKKDYDAGPEFVTPVGIGITQGINQGYDFSTIILNNEKIRIFNKKQITVLELLTIAGVKSTQIMGRSGKNLSFTLNDERKVVKGKLQIPSRVTVNGVQSSLNSVITQGDKVHFVPAIKGEDGKAFAGEFGTGASGTITFLGEKYAFGSLIIVNGREAEQDLEIFDGDIVETREIHTLAQLILQLKIEFEGITYSKGGVGVPLDYRFKDGDEISIDDKAFDFTEQSKNNAKPLAQRALSGNILEEKEEITIRLNGKSIELPAKSDGSPYIFIDMYNLLDFDVAERGANLLMILNGIDANFTDILEDGDDIIIR